MTTRCNANVVRLTVVEPSTRLLPGSAAPATGYKSSQRLIEMEKLDQWQIGQLPSVKNCLAIL